MAMTKGEVCRAFRTVMAADYADVPPAETIDHSFSAGFLSVRYITIFLLLSEPIEFVETPSMP